MTVRIEESLPPVLYASRMATTVVQPGARTRPLRSQMMPYRSQDLPPRHQDNRISHPEAGQTYTIHRDMSGLKSDLLGHIVDLYV